MFDEVYDIYDCDRTSRNHNSLLKPKFCVEKDFASVSNYSTKLSLSSVWPKMRSLLVE